MASPRSAWPWACALVAAVFAVYWPVRAHGFVSYDDPVYLTENAHVAGGLDAREIAWVFTHDHAANYHPLTWLSHMLDVELFGLERPGAHHLVSVGLHALNALLVFALARRLFDGRLGPAAFAAAAFALHPLRVESVAWASERKDVLCALFYLGACLLHLGYAERPSPARFAAVLVTSALALLAKPMAVTLPGALLLLDAWPLGRLVPGRRCRVVLEKLPLCALVAAACAATWIAQERGGSTSGLSELALSVRALNALATLAVYVGQTLVPARLSVFYPHAAIVSATPVRALLGPALAGGALLLAFALATRRGRWPALFLGGAWFFGTLLPVLGLVQVGTQAHADRYTYLPAIGLTLALTSLALALVPARWAALLGGVALALLAWRTREQVAVWSSSRALFEHALSLDGRNYLAHEKLGEEALEAGRGEEAERSFRATLEIHPVDLDALNNLALLLLARGELGEARALLERAERRAPADHDTQLNLGALALEADDFEGAEKRFRACLARDPRDADALYNLGALEQRAGRMGAAEARFEELLAFAPTHADAWSNLGQVRLGAGNTEGALAAFERVVALAPDDPLAYFNLGVALRRSGALARARAAFQRALALDPTFELAESALSELDGAGG